MTKRSLVVYGLLALGMALPLYGCGDGSNNDNIEINPGTPTPRRTSTPGVGATSTPVSATATAVNEATPTATTTSGTEPTATSTPSGGPACQSGDQIVVMASVDKDFGAVNIHIAYPAAANIPGTGTAQSVKDRVTFAHAGGLTAVSDLDTNADGTDDTLSLSTVNTSSTPAGLFATVTFDCLPGQSRPDASAFTCSVQSASTPDGADIANENCTLAVQ